MQWFDACTVTTSLVFFLFVIYRRIVRRNSSILTVLSRSHNEQWAQSASVRKITKYREKKSQHTHSIRRAHSRRRLTQSEKPENSTRLKAFSRFFSLELEHSSKNSFEYIILGLEGNKIDRVGKSRRSVFFFVVRFHIHTILSFVWVCVFS